MKTMGSSPPHDKTIEAEKRKIWAEQCREKNKSPTPFSTMLDQLGATAMEETPESGMFDCEICEEPFGLGKGFITDGWKVFYCAECFADKIQ